LFRQVEEQSNCFLLPFEDMVLFLPTPADPSPSPRQAGLSKQRLPNLYGVVARHVLRRIRSFDIEVVGLHSHVGIIVKRDGDVQRHI